MPHVIIKAVAGQPKEKLEEAARKMAAVLGETLGAPAKYISVSLETDYPVEDWEGIYNEYIKDKENVVVKPGYTNPKTFE